MGLSQRKYLSATQTDMNAICGRILAANSKEAGRWLSLCFSVPGCQVGSNLVSGQIWVKVAKLACLPGLM